MVSIFCRSTNEVTAIGVRAVMLVFESIKSSVMLSTKKSNV
ncbi:Uncharacterised protein [Vibrio cholerae]|nr:Uncharacterised protein [Vibrio cholerae]